MPLAEGRAGWSHVARVTSSVRGSIAWAWACVPVPRRFSQVAQRTYFSAHLQVFNLVEALVDAGVRIGILYPR